MGRPTAHENVQVPRLLASRRDGGHLPERPLPDDERRMARLPGRQEGGDLRGVVLAVRVERDDGLRARRERVPEPGPQRGTLALVGHLPQDRRAGRLRHIRGAVLRAVIHDDHGQVATRRPR